MQQTLSTRLVRFASRLGAAKTQQAQPVASRPVQLDDKSLRHIGGGIDLPKKFW